MLDKHNETNDGDRCVEIMRTLLAKHPEGYDGWAKQRGEHPASNAKATEVYNTYRGHLDIGESPS